MSTPPSAQRERVLLRSWLPPLEQMPTLVNSLHGALQQLRDDPRVAVPNLESSRRVMAFSDYSSREGAWSTAAFLFTPLEGLPAFVDKLRAVRRAHGIVEPRRFEYKSLKDKLKWKALPDWLAALDGLPGVVFVLLIHRDIASALQGDTGKPSEDLVEFLRSEGFGDWSKTASGAKLAEQAVRIIHTVAYWHGLLAGPNVELQWLTDNDEIFAGELRRESVRKLLRVVVEKYCGKPTPCVVASEADAAGGEFAQLLSIPDLMSAAVLEHQRGVDAGATDAIAKAAVVMQWLAVPSSLTKVCLRLELDGGTVNWSLYQPYFQPTAVVG